MCVPILGIPVFGDQFNNAKMIEQKTFGMILKNQEDCKCIIE